MDRPIYLDHNATTPPAPSVVEAMLPFLTRHFGNPSSAHAYGAAARDAVERARQEVAGLLGARAEEVVFTSGGSEANTTAILGVARRHGGARRHLVTSAVEHPAVLEPCRALAREGYRLTVLPVDGEGRVAPDAVAAVVGADTLLVTVMHANNEVGTLQDVASIARVARAAGALVHTDAAQSAGKVPVDVRALGVDLLSLAGHKLYGPKGIGALFVRTGVEIPPLVLGAAHEGGRRAGTENVPGIVGLGRACALAAEALDERMVHARGLRDRLWAALAASGLALRRNGAPDGLPNTLSVSFRGVAADRLLAEVAGEVAASPGAACHAKGHAVSPVLVAMGVPPEYARGTVRLSVGATTTERDVDDAARALVAAARTLLHLP